MALPSLQRLWEQAQLELDVVKQGMAFLAKFSKGGNIAANTTIETALVQATAQLRLLSDILAGR